MRIGIVKPTFNSSSLLIKRHRRPTIQLIFSFEIGIVKPTFASGINGFGGLGIDMIMEV
jgi:hypothetical protein